jgi:hypothetical protein
MGDFYGYNPAAYIKDFSWIGHMGDTIGKFATQMPELLEMNKQIKENNKFKDSSYAASNQFIDKLDDGQVTKIASSMGIDYSKPFEARQKLKEKIPKFSDKTTNEEYAGQIVNSFFAPVMQHAMSEKGYPLTVGDIITRVNSGAIQSSMYQTQPGKDFQTDVSNKKELTQHGAMQTQSNDINNKNTFGPNADMSGGTAGAQQNVELDTRSKEMDQTKQAGQESGSFISQAVNSSSKPEEAYQKVVDAGGTDKDAEQASTMVRQRLEDQLKKDQLRNSYAKRLLDKKELETIDPQKFPNIIKDAAKTVGTIGDDILKLKEKKKKGLIENADYEERLADLNIQLQTAKINQKAANNSYNFFLNSGGKTKSDANSAERVGGASVNAEQQMNRTPTPGADTTLKNYKPSPIAEQAINDAKNQMQTKGSLEPDLKRFLISYASKQGISLEQFLTAQGIKSQGNNNRDNEQTNNNSVNQIDYRKVAAAKAILNKPDSPEWNEKKKQAKSFLDANQITY